MPTKARLIWRATVAGPVVSVVVARRSTASASSTSTVPEAGRRVDQRLGCPDRADSERRLDGLVARAHQDRGDGVGLDQGARHQLPVLRGHRQCESHLGLASRDVPVGGAEPCLRGHSLGLTGQLDERGGANERVARNEPSLRSSRNASLASAGSRATSVSAEHCRRELPAHLVDHARPHDQVANPIRSLGQHLGGEVVDGASVRKLHCGLGRRRAFQRERRKAYAARPPVRVPLHEPGSQVSRIDLVPWRAPRPPRAHPSRALRRRPWSAGRQHGAAGSRSPVRHG